VFQQTVEDENSIIPKQKHQPSGEYVLETPCTFVYKSFGTIDNYNRFHAVVLYISFNAVSGACYVIPT